ncbi:hypothetical protein BDZ45DRAFT_736186 [Acephala macrosclerotiorum]|nr:hypothetical protein BDZ45DRAFT_736186 [Acephala macrosclerotiorum]
MTPGLAPAETQARIADMSKPQMLSSSCSCPDCKPKHPNIPQEKRARDVAKHTSRLPWHLGILFATCTTGANCHLIGLSKDKITQEKQKEHARLKKSLGTKFFYLFLRVSMTIVMVGHLIYEFKFGGIAQNMEIYGIQQRGNTSHLWSGSLYTQVFLAFLVGGVMYGQHQMVTFGRKYEPQKWLEDIETCFKNLDGAKNTKIEDWSPKKDTQTKMRQFASCVTDPGNDPFEQFSGLENAVDVVWLTSFVSHVDVHMYLERCMYDIAPTMEYKSGIILYMVIQALVLVWAVEDGYGARIAMAAIEDENKAQDMLARWKGQLLKRVSDERKGKTEL